LAKTGVDLLPEIGTKISVKFNVNIIPLAMELEDDETEGCENGVSFDWGSLDLPLGAPHFHGPIIISYLKKMIQGGANEAGPIFN